MFPHQSNIRTQKNLVISSKSSMARNSTNHNLKIKSPFVNPVPNPTRTTKSSDSESENLNIFSDSICNVCDQAVVNEVTYFCKECTGEFYPRCISPPCQGRRDSRFESWVCPMCEEPYICFTFLDVLASEPCVLTSSNSYVLPSSDCHSYFTICISCF